MKKLFSLTVALFILCSYAFAAPGDIAGNIYYTDIKTYIYHSPVTSYNIGGKTVIDAEILNWHYGFDVYWYEDTRRLEITDKGGTFNSLQAMSGELVEGADGIVGDIQGVYYETDIVTLLNGSPIESYNIGGRTFIVAEEMRNFGYDVTYDEESRTLTITKPMDFYKIETDYGVIKTFYNAKGASHFAVSERGIIAGEKEIPLKSNTVLHGAGVGDDYIKLSDFVYLTGAKCDLIEQTETGHSEYVNGISYDETYYTYCINLDLPAIENADYPEIKEDYTVSYIDTDDSYSITCGLIINGKESSFVKYNAKSGEYPADILIVNGEIYIPAYSAAKLLGFEYGR